MKGRALPAACAAACVLVAAVCLGAAVYSLSSSRKTTLAIPASREPCRQPATVREDGLHVNTASREELAALPGISEKIADGIIEAREKSPFFFVEDLKVVDGIGDRRVEALRSLVAVP